MSAGFTELLLEGKAAETTNRLRFVSNNRFRRQ